VHLGDLVRIDDVTDVRRDQVLGARRAPAPPAGACGALSLGSAAALDLVRQTLRRMRR